MRQWAVGLVLIGALLIGSWGAWDAYQRQRQTIANLQDSVAQQHLQLAQLNDRLVALDRQQRQQPSITEAATQLSQQSSRQSVLLLLQFAQQHVDHAQIPAAIAQLQQLEQQLALSGLSPAPQDALRRVIQHDIATLKQRHQQQQHLWGLQDTAIARLQDLLQINAKTMPHPQPIVAQGQEQAWPQQLQGWVSVRRADPAVWLDLNQRALICYQALMVLGQIRTALPQQPPDTLRRLWQDVDHDLAQLSDGQSVQARQLAQQLAMLPQPAAYPLHSLQLWQTDRGDLP